MTRREWVLTAVVAVIAGASGYAYNAWRSSLETDVTRAAQVLEAIELPNVEGQPQALRQWRGKVLVVNFWATWCAPCREEIPAFIKLQERYGHRGLQFVGIAIDEAPRVRPYAAQLGMNFPVLIAGMRGIELSRAAGNTAAVLPFTVIFGRDGRVVTTHVGVYKEEKLEPLLTPLL